jgi:hypothetical protein
MERENVSHTFQGETGKEMYGARGLEKSELTKS